MNPARQGPALLPRAHGSPLVSAAGAFEAARGQVNLRRKQTMRSIILAVCAALGLGWFTETASAQQYPTKPVRIITPFPAGSGPDGVLRVVGEKLTKMWGRQVIVENRPGGNGFIGLEAAKKAPPDGYTFVQADEGHMALNPHLYKKIP